MRTVLRLATLCFAIAAVATLVFGVYTEATKASERPSIAEAFLDRVPPICKENGDCDRPFTLVGEVETKTGSGGSAVVSTIATIILHTYANGSPPILDVIITNGPAEGVLPQMLLLTDEYADGNPELFHGLVYTPQKMETGHVFNIFKSATCEAVRGVRPCGTHDEKSAQTIVAMYPEFLKKVEEQLSEMSQVGMPL